jgi:hypothetical protein
LCRQGGCCLRGTDAGVGGRRERHAAPNERGEVTYGGFSGEVVVLGPATTSISVYRGETVRIIDEQTGHSFLWRFDSDEKAVDLNQVAPVGVMGGQHVIAYVLD